jgi:hypothetical protein
MPIPHAKFVSSFLTGGLLLVALVGCSTSSPQASSSPSSSAIRSTAPRASATASSTPSPTADAKSAKVGAANALEQLYDRTFSMSSKSVKAAKQVNSDHEKYGAKEYSDRIEALVPGLAYIYKGGSDPATLASFEYGYTTSTLSIAESLAAQGADADIAYHVDQSKLKLSADGREVEIPGSAISATFNGKSTGQDSSSLGGISLYAVQDTDGKWYIDPSRITS